MGRRNVAGIVNVYRNEREKILMSKVELYYEPLEILNSLSDSKAEMFRWQLAFLRGLV